MLTTLKEVLAHIKDTGFTITPDLSLGDPDRNQRVVDTGEGDFVLLYMPDEETFDEAEVYGDFEVWVSCWDDLNTLNNDGAGVIFCGGLYVFMRIFAYGELVEEPEALSGTIPEDPTQPIQ